MGKDSEDDNKVEIERITDSPNIDTDSNDIDGLRDAISSSSQQSKIDKKPIRQEDIKFDSANISRPDGKELMVNVEGSQKRKIEEAKQKKKDQQEAEKRKKTEERKRKHDAQVIKRNKRINNLRTIAQKIWKLKFVFLGVIIITAIVILLVKVINPTVSKIKTETKKIAEEKIVEENKTTIIKIYQELAGKKFTKEELEQIVNSKNANISITYEDSSGDIGTANGGAESIIFSISQDGQNTISNFYYYNCIDDKDVEIFGADGNYQYNYDNQLKNFDNINEAISAYILEMHEAGNEI
jgi:hypothetical protein